MLRHSPPKKSWSAAPLTSPIALSSPTPGLRSTLPQGFVQRGADWNYCFSVPVTSASSQYQEPFGHSSGQLLMWSWITWDSTVYNIIGYHFLTSCLSTNYLTSFFNPEQCNFPTELKYLQYFCLCDPCFFIFILIFTRKVMVGCLMTFPEPRYWLHHFQSGRSLLGLGDDGQGEGL